MPHKTANINYCWAIVSLRAIQPTHYTQLVMTNCITLRQLHSRILKILNLYLIYPKFMNHSAPFSSRHVGLLTFNGHSTTDSTALWVSSPHHATAIGVGSQGKLLFQTRWEGFVSKVWRLEKYVGNPGFQGLKHWNMKNIIQLTTPGFAETLSSREDDLQSILEASRSRWSGSDNYRKQYHMGPLELYNFGGVEGMRDRYG